MLKHSKGCVCVACYAASVAKGKSPDPNQGDLLAAVKNDSTQSSLTVQAGQERKQEALTAHDQRRRGTLLWLREALRSLYRARARGDHGETYRLKPYVTADDAERILRLFPDRIPEGSGAWKGSIFRGNDWQFTGDLIPSVIAENNGRGQRAWRYVGP